MNERNKLRREANEMIEDKLPQMWKDGDIRYVDGATYDKIESLMKEATTLELGESKMLALETSTDRKFKLTFRGQFGEIEIRNARKIREDLKDDA